MSERSTKLRFARAEPESETGGDNTRAQQRRGIKKSYAAERTRRQRAESAAASVRT